jgi:hypothetical protein
MRLNRTLPSAVGVALSLIACDLFAADAPAQKPATVAEAAKVLDLSKFPLLEGAPPAGQRNLAMVSYEAPGAIKPAFAFIQKQFATLKWQELPMSYLTDEYASGTFARDGYKVSVSVTAGAMPKHVNVTMTNHGNVDLDKLPTPKGVKPFYGSPVSKAYITETPTDKTAEELRKLLLAQGWQPYGFVGDVWSFKQNAVKLSARVSSAPAQGGKTVIDYFTVLMSADIPAPAETEGLHFTDTPTQLSFDSAESKEDIVKFYRTTLEKSGWKATTDNLLKLDFREYMIFRNAAKDLRELQVHTFEGKTRVMLKHQTATEVAAEEERAKAAIAAKNAEKNKPKPKLAVTLPAGAKEVDEQKTRIEFQLATGKAKAAVDALRKQFAKEGWKEEEGATAEEQAGTMTLKKGEFSLTILYVDPGFIPAEITLSSFGVELERAAEKK